MAEDIFIFRPFNTFFKMSDKVVSVAVVFELQERMCDRLGWTRGLNLIQ